MANPIILELPMPPSVNAIWRHSRGHVYKTKNYVAWQKECDSVCLLKHQYPKERITGPFEISIYLARSFKGDGDNRIKAVLDWLQSREIIRNDSDCVEGHWKWVSTEAAQLGCHVVLTPISST